MMMMMNSNKIYPNPNASSEGYKNLIFYAIVTPLSSEGDLQQYIRKLIHNRRRKRLLLLSNGGKTLINPPSSSANNNKKHNFHLL